MRLAYNLREEPDTTNVRDGIDHVACIHRAAAISTAELLQSNASEAAAAHAELLPQLQSIRNQLDSIMVRHSEAGLDAALLDGHVTPAQQLQHAVLLQINPPAPCAMGRGGGGASAAAAAAAVPPAPAAGCDVEDFWAWLQSLQECNSELSCHIVIESTEQFMFALVHDQLHGDLLRRAPALQMHTIETLAKILSNLRVRLRAAYACAGPTVEAQSREALAVWAVLAITHRTAVAAWQGLLEYSLPLNPDDLRWLVLSHAAAYQATCTVAAYIAAYAGMRKQIFTTARGGAATLDMAARYVKEHLHSRAAEELELAQRREQLHWDAVQKKQDALEGPEGLDAQLRVAEAALRKAEGEEQRAFIALRKVRACTAFKRQAIKCLRLRLCGLQAEDQVRCSMVAA